MAATKAQAAEFNATGNVYRVALISAGVVDIKKNAAAIVDKVSAL